MANASVRLKKAFKQLKGPLLTLALFAPLSATLTRAAPTASGVRSVFLNGTDISSARSQDLKNVDLHINEAGDIFIVAPHYQVNEEDTYVPLSKFVQGMNAPEHKKPQAIETKVTSPKAVPGAPEPKAGTAMLPKAGSPVEPEAASAAPEAKAVKMEAPADEPAAPTLPDDAPAGEESK